MAKTHLIAAVSLLAFAAPVTASQSDPAMAPEMAPAGTPDTRYCMRIEASTNSRVEKIKCWTRQEWAEQGVDVDADWAKEGVTVIG